MSKLKSTDKTLLLLIANLALTIGAMFAMMFFLGRENGLVVIVISLICQVAYLNRRVVALEQELHRARESSDGGPATVVSKAELAGR
jgi:hypothetical protein